MANFMTLEQYRQWQARHKKKGHPERNIQVDCVEWFRNTFPDFLCFSVPNGGSRNAIEASNLKREGALAGVSDLICVSNNKVLFVEIKAAKGRQTERQKDFEGKVWDLGFPYIVCRSLNEFKKAIVDWLKNQL